MKSKIMNPKSNIATFSVSLIITLLLSNTIPTEIADSDSIFQTILYHLFINPIVDNISIIYIILFSWLVFTVAYSIFQPRIEREVERYREQEKIVDELKNNLKSDAGLLMSRYSDLTKFKLKDALEENIRKFSDSKYTVESAQLYRYNYIPEIHETTIKVEYSGGYAKEGININAIMQSYYHIPTRLLESIWTIINLSEKLFQQDDEVEEFINAIFEAIDDIGINAINEIKMELASCLQCEEDEDVFLKDKEADLYTLLQTFISILYENDDDIEENDDIDDVHQIKNIFNKSIKKLKVEKRTGILEAILRQDYSIFEHKGNSEKKGRAYISKCISLNEEKYVLLISSSPYVSEEREWKNKLHQTCCDLEGVLKTAFVKE